MSTRSGQVPGVEHDDVIIAGAGPCGLVLALELGRRGIRTRLFNDRPSTSPHPAANATQARTMEHFRRLGVAERVRGAGLPPDYRPDIAYFTRFNGYELTRMRQPTAAETEALARESDGGASVAELPHRASQMYVERILREQAETLPSVSLCFGCEVTQFEDQGDRVSVSVRNSDGTQAVHTARYLVGADGARSRVRGELGIRYGGTRDTDRPFLAGAMYSTYFRSNDVYKLIPHPAAWQYWAVNPDRRGLLISLDGDSSFVMAAQLRGDEDADTLSDEAARQIIYAAVGERFDLQIVSRSPWTAGLTLVADSFRTANTFLGGDAVHLFTPTGGLGYNTAVEDAVNLAWKLAAVLQGWGGPGLLDSYELERKPVAERNTTFARTLAQSIGGFTVPAEIEDATSRGEQARAEIGQYLAAHARNEFNIPGITLGARYDGSPVIVPDGSTPPADDPGEYAPTACPGGRAPHTWLPDDRSLYDAFGLDFTLLAFNGRSTSTELFEQAAAKLRTPLTVLELADAGLREHYAAELALIRPDQVVCWRGSGDELDADAVLRRVTGW